MVFLTNTDQKIKNKHQFPTPPPFFVAWKPSDQFAKSIKSFAFSSSQFGPVKNG